jgi:hypothetical protein
MNLKGRDHSKTEDNIKTYIGQIGWESVDWILLAQDRDQLQALVNKVMNRRVP